MNWAQFKDPVSHVCLAGDVVAPRSLTQEVAGSSPFIEFSENIYEKLHCSAENINRGTHQLAQNSANRAYPRGE